MEIFLDSFEMYVRPAALSKGQQYFYDGRVDKLREAVSGNWIAEVKGSKKYEVEIEIKGKELEFYSCDCPVDDHEICKHIVAVLLEIRDRRLTNRAYEDYLLPEDEYEGDSLDEVLVDIHEENWESAEQGSLNALYYSGSSKERLKWLQKLLKVAQQKGDKEAILLRAGELFPGSRYQLQYFEVLKAHTPSQNWPTEVDLWLERIRAADSGPLKKHKETLAEILSREDRLSELREHLFLHKNDLDLVEKYRARLLPDHATEMLDLSCHALMIFASFASGKLKYKRLANSLRDLESLKGGAARTQQLKAYFQAEYRDRPRLLEALDQYLPKA